MVLWRIEEDPNRGHRYREGVADAKDILKAVSAEVDVEGKGEERWEKRESGQLTFSASVSQAGDDVTYETKGEAGFDGSGRIVGAGLWVCAAELSVGYLLWVANKHLEAHAWSIVKGLI